MPARSPTTVGMTVNTTVISIAAADTRRSATGYFRMTGSPNLRQQDGVKQGLLCHDCEHTFSKAEGWFERTVFTPYLENSQSTFAYDEELFKFTASILWRVRGR